MELLVTGLACVGALWVLSRLAKMGTCMREAHEAGMAACRSEMVYYTCDEFEAKAVCLAVREHTGRPEKSCNRIPHPRHGHGWRIEADSITKEQVLAAIEVLINSLRTELMKTLERVPTPAELKITCKQHTDEAFAESNKQFGLGLP